MESKKTLKELAELEGLKIDDSIDSCPLVYMNKGNLSSVRGVNCDESCDGSCWNTKPIEDDEPRFLLDEDSICYGCKYYEGDDDCRTPQPCFEGSMNGYRMEG